MPEEQIKSQQGDKPRKLREKTDRNVGNHKEQPKQRTTVTSQGQADTVCEREKGSH